MIRLLIADDHAIVRKGLRQIVEEEPDIQVAGEAGTALELLAKVSCASFDLLILDISMPGSHGLDVLRQIKANVPRLPVLVLTMHPEGQYAVRALKEGASGYLAKESAPDELIVAIRKTAGGGKYVSASLAELLADLLRTETNRPPLESLSEREYQVFSLIASGRTVTEIALELHLSPKTVSTYRTRILEKLSLENSAQIMKYALDHNLVG